MINIYQFKSFGGSMFAETQKEANIINFISEKELQPMFVMLKSKSSQNSYYVDFEDEHLQSLLNCYLLLTKHPDIVFEHLPGISKKDLLYNRYYQFIKFKKEYRATHGDDAGMEQQAFQLLEEIERELEDGIDWSVIEEIGE